MGIIGCLLGFLIVIIFCYKDWSVYIATIVGAAVVMLFNWLPLSLIHISEPTRH